MMKYLKIFAFSLFAFGLTGCDETLVGSGGTEDPTPEPGVPVASQLVIQTDKSAVQSDGSDAAAITVTALDANNALVEGANITVTTTGGQLDAAVITTDAQGKAYATFSASAIDPTNQTVTITATSGTPTASIPVQIVGSTIKYISTASQLTAGDTAGGDTAQLTLLASDSGGNGVYNTPVTVTIDAASTATGQLDPAGSASQTYTANTDSAGQVSVDVKGLTAGDLVVTASALGATTSQTLLVVSTAGALQITSPLDSSAHQVNTSIPVAIAVPADMPNVTLATSLGQWTTVNGVAVNSPTHSVTGVAGTVINAVLTATETGTATIQAFNTDNVAVTDVVTLLLVNSTVDALSNITIQAETNTVPVSVGDTLYSVTLTGRVTDASNNAIAGAFVSLSMLNQPGGGEYLDKAFVFSDAAGVFEVIFYSGSIGSDSNGVDIVATLEGNGKTDSANIIISQTAGSVVLSEGTKLSAINSDTAYSLPMSVLVADANGSPVPDATVSLKIWPKYYRTGFWDAEGNSYVTGSFPNEDVNRNLILDAGEDGEFVEGHYVTTYGTGYYFNADLNADGDGYDVIGGDGSLTPPNSASGTIPSSVTTDANGVGTFNLVYLKSYAWWITAELTATVQVQGTESTGVLTFVLPALESDATGGHLNDSPFNNIGDSSFSPGGIGMSDAGVGAMASSDFVDAGGNAMLTVLVVDDLLQPVSGATVNLAFLSQNSTGIVAPTLSTTTLTTGSDGKATATYTAGDVAGLDEIKVQYNDGVSLFTNTIRINVLAPVAPAP